MSNRRRISDLIDASNDNKTIVDVMKCHVSTVNRVRAIKRADDPITPRKRPGRPTIKTGPGIVLRLRGAVDRQPRCSIREHARRLGISKGSARACLKKLRIRSRTRQRRLLLDERMRGLRLVRSKVLLNNLKSAPARRIIFFSDEKTFTVSEAYNRRNNMNPAAIGPDGNVEASTSGTLPPTKSWLRPCYWGR